MIVSEGERSRPVPGHPTARPNSCTDFRQDSGHHSLEGTTQTNARNAPRFLYVDGAKPRKGIHMIRIRWYCCVAQVLLIPMAGMASSTEDARKHYEQGVVALQNEAFDQAIAEFTEAIQPDPKNTDAYYARLLPSPGGG